MDLGQFVRLVRGSAVIRLFYHFTDLQNVDSIKRHGLLSMRELRNRGLAVTPGGNDWSLEADQACGMDAYVHLCFRRNHSMEYKARKAGRQMRFIEVDPAVIEIPGVMVSDDVANQSGVIPRPAAEMLDELDLEVIYSRTRWADPLIQARLRQVERYEVLVPDHVPVDLIRKF